MRDGWGWTDDEPLSSPELQAWDENDDEEEWDEDLDWDDEEGDEDDEGWSDEDDDEWEEWEEEFEDDEDESVGRRKPHRHEWN
jgi:hypothetical protein